jgi:hypothetical protein
MKKDSIVANIMNSLYCSYKMTRLLTKPGVNIVTYPCGTILSVSELYGSESLSQVFLPIHELMSHKTMQDNIKCFLHDNACHFKNFLTKRRLLTGVTQIMDRVDIAIDRHHFPNHIDAFCKANYNPWKKDILIDVNTSVMEQGGFQDQVVI